MKKISAFLIAMLLIVAQSYAQFARVSSDPKPVAQAEVPVNVVSSYQAKSFITGNDTMPYRLLFPKNYDSSKQYPIIIFLHGSGERGSDNQKQLLHGGALFVRDDLREKFPAFVVFPQCSEKSYWSNVKITEDPVTKKKTLEFQAGGEPTQAMTGAMNLTKKLMSDYPVKKDQVYVMGLSMGGMGTFEIVRRMPNTFAAAISMCGGADTTTGRAIKKTAWWIIHGAKDEEVSPKFSENMVMELRKYYGVEMEYTIYPEAGHNCWDPAFKEPDLLPWLFQQQLGK